MAHPPKIPGALNKPGSVGRNGVQGQRPSRVQGCEAPWAEIDFKYFLCAETASPGVFFMIINLLFLLQKQKTKNKKLHHV